jgi:hypothetical protein
MGTVAKFRIEDTKVIYVICPANISSSFSEKLQVYVIEPVLVLEVEFGPSISFHLIFP